MSLDMEDMDACFLSFLPLSIFLLSSLSLFFFLCSLLQAWALEEIRWDVTDFGLFLFCLFDCSLFFILPILFRSLPFPLFNMLQSVPYLHIKACLVIWLVLFNYFGLVYFVSFIELMWLVIFGFAILSYVKLLRSYKIMWILTIIYN